MTLQEENHGRILILDDDEDILDLLRYNFLKEGYVVKSISNSINPIKQAKSFKPDLVILDVMMLPYNGIEVCKLFRSDKSLEDIYIFFLTANSDDYYRNAAFNVGGDEFVEKIVGLKPLIAKVTCVLKQKLVIRKRLTLISGSLELHRGAEIAYWNGKQLTLHEHEFEILFFLVQNPGRVISLSQIVNSLWGSKTFMDEHAVLNFIKNLRNKLGPGVIEGYGSNFRYKLRDTNNFFIS